MTKRYPFAPMRGPGWLHVSRTRIVSGFAREEVPGGNAKFHDMAGAELVVVSRVAGKVPRRHRALSSGALR